MYLEERIPTYIEEIKTFYHCDEMDMSEVYANRGKIWHMNCAKKVVKKLNEQIDLDFIKESNLLENVKDVDVDAFLGDEDTKIYHNGEEGVLPAISDGERMIPLLSSVVVAYNPSLGVLAFTNDHLKAFEYVLSEARQSQVQQKTSGEFKPLTHEVITNANQKIMTGKFEIKSAYRNERTFGSCHVLGANWTPAANAKVPARMEALVQWYNQESEMDPIIKAAILHCEFIGIHPFCDGNGRTARLLVNYELAKHKLPTIVIKARNKKAYLAALEKGIMTGDVTDVANMIRERVLESQQRQIEGIEKFQLQQKQLIDKHKTK